MKHDSKVFGMNNRKNGLAIINKMEKTVRRIGLTGQSRVSFWTC